MKKITTVLGDIIPEQLGHTSIHEHTIVSQEALFPPALVDLLKGKRKRVTHDDVLDAETEELQAFKEAGGQSLMDCSCNGIRLDIRDIRTISERSGVNIVACTGLYIESTYPKEVNPQDSTAIRAFELNDIREGINGTDIKADCIKIAFGPADQITGAMSENELSVMKASLSVAAETGYPVTIHPPLKENIHKILDIAINEYGIAPEKIDVCHLDNCISDNRVYPDYLTFTRNSEKAIAEFTAYAKSILDRGVFINFDSWGWGDGLHKLGINGLWSIGDEYRLAALVPLLKKGYGSQIMLGQDKTAPFLNYHEGAYGFTRFLKYAIPALKANGFEKDVELLTKVNPAKFLSHD